jgi:hypothetical protein
MVAAIIGIALALALPKRVERKTTNARCTAYEVLPFGFYVLEGVFGRIGVRYASGEDCR